MRQFFKYVLAVIVGLLLCCLFFFVIGLGIVGALTRKEKISVKPNSVIHAKFDSPIGEITKEDPFNKLSGKKDQLGLYDLFRTLEKAKTDDKIKGIFLDLQGSDMRLATLEAVREKLHSFKESGKFIIAYGESLPQKTYYLSSVADKVYLNPSGLMEIKGFASEVTFFKGTLDKLEIEPQIFYAGKYKSATEPFRRTDMSEENKVQIKELLDDFHKSFVENIARDRKLTTDQVNDIIQNFKVRKVEDAQSLGLVDGIAFYDEVLAKVRENMGLGKEDKINLISLDKYRKSFDLDGKYHKTKLALVTAEGDIVDGKGTDDNIGSEKYAKILREIEEDENVKAVVLRVNSPGGSGLASDVMLREIERIKQSGRPVIVSMGDLAASGGYFISCNADRIFAQKNSITGSIGVFGMFATIDKFMNDKLGITFDRVKTAPYADFMSTLNRPLTSEEGVIIQNFINDFYDRFITKVANGRRMEKDAVNEVAQGRVWSGRQAIEKGLVDEIGGIEEAIVYAVKQANLTDYRIKQYPVAKDKIQELLKELSGEETTARAIQQELGAYYHLYKEATYWKNMYPVQTRMPFMLEVY